MSNDKIDGHFTMLKPVRALYCNVLNARKFVKNGKEVGDAKFDCTFALDDDDIKGMKDKAIEVAKAKWPGVALKELKWPFKTKDAVVAAAGKAKAKKGGSADEIAKATEKAKELYPDGFYFVKAASKYDPQLSYLDGKKIVEFTEANKGLAKTKFYNGCYVLASLNFVPYIGDDDNGVTVYLDQVLWIKDGPKIGGGSRSPAEAFKGYVGALSGEDPTGGASNELDDEIPF